jgi:hypothetical protein
MLFPLLYLLAAVTASVAAETTADLSQAKPVAVAVDKDFTFPETFEGTDVSHDFIIRNTGTAPLIIDHIKTSCSCTTASYTESIPPGGEGIVSVKLRTRGYGGKLAYQTAHVYTNDPANPLIPLSMTGPVETFVDIVPSLVRLNGPLGFVLKKQVRVLPGNKYPFKIIGATAADGKNIRFDIQEATFGERKGYALNIENTKTDAGTYQDIITIKTDSDKKSQLEIRVFGSVYDPAELFKNNLVESNASE